MWPCTAEGDHYCADISAEAEKYSRNYFGLMDDFTVPIEDATQHYTHLKWILIICYKVLWFFSTNALDKVVLVVL